MGDILSSLRTWRAWRNPMVAIGTFRTHDDNQAARQNAEIDRERRRQEVIQVALKRRQQRKAKRQANASSSGSDTELKITNEAPTVEMREIMLKVELNDIPKVEC